MSAEERRLPAAVEHLISTISDEKSTPPPNAAATQILAEIGEEEALDVLRTIRNSKSIRTFSGFIVHLVKNKKKRNHSLSPHISPDTITVPPCCGGYASPSPVIGTRSGDALTPNKRKRTLNISDEVVTSIVEHFAGSSTSSDAVANTRKDHFTGTNTASAEKAYTQMSNSVPDAFAEFEF
ncbi:hypothetical protein RND81_06G162300 [Saponaria officinalis]|uniref:RDRP3-5 N-terminal domain-containing protein n=1 Tax=Saponaria officinalis TaxID=3572 RepID=A0AAW1KDQ9_SAPOF